MRHAKSARANTRYAYQEEIKCGFENLNSLQEISTKATKGRHVYKQHIHQCNTCKKKFYINRFLADNIIRKGMKIECSPCKGSQEPARYVDPETIIKLERFYEAKGCTVRKMTPKERKKYGL